MLKEDGETHTAVPFFVRAVMAEISDNGEDIFLEYSRAKVTASSRDRSRVNGKKQSPLLWLP